MSRGLLVGRWVWVCCRLILGHRGGLGFRRCFLDFVLCCRICRFLLRSNCRSLLAFVVGVCLARCALVVLAWDLIAGVVSGRSFFEDLADGTHSRSFPYNCPKLFLRASADRNHSRGSPHQNLLVLAELVIAFSVSFGLFLEPILSLDLASQVPRGCVLSVSSVYLGILFVVAVIGSRPLASRGSQSQLACLGVSILIARGLHHPGKTLRAICAALCPCYSLHFSPQGFWDGRRGLISCLLHCHFGFRSDLAVDLDLVIDRKDRSVRLASIGLGTHRWSARDASGLEF